MNFVNCSSVQTWYAPTKFLGHGEVCRNVYYVHCYMSYINWTHLLISRAQAESYWPHAFIAVTAIMLTLKFLALQSITQTLTKKIKILEESRLLYCQFCSWLHFSGWWSMSLTCVSLFVFAEGAKNTSVGHHGYSWAMNVLAYLVWQDQLLCLWCLTNDIMQEK